MNWTWNITHAIKEIWWDWMIFPPYTKIIHTYLEEHQINNISLTCCINIHKVYCTVRRRNQLFNTPEILEKAQYMFLNGEFSPRNSFFILAELILNPWQ